MCLEVFGKMFGDFEEFLKACFHKAEISTQNNSLFLYFDTHPPLIVMWKKENSAPSGKFHLERGLYKAFS